jgi:hypothetical protein
MHGTVILSSFYVFLCENKLMEGFSGQKSGGESRMSQASLGTKIASNGGLPFGVLPIKIFIYDNFKQRAIHWR